MRDAENSKPIKDELPLLAQSWLRSYYMYVQAFNKLLSRYRSLKKRYMELIKENEELKQEIQNTMQVLENNIVDERLLKFKQQWGNPVKHIRSDITNEEIIELYSIGMRPYRIAKVLQEKKGVNVSYRTIISRINKLREKGIIQ